MSATERMAAAVASQGIPGEAWPDEDLAALDVAQVPAWTRQLQEAEASLRRLRTRLQALAEGTERECACGCGNPVTGRADAIYASAACRVRAHRGQRTAG